MGEYIDNLVNWLKSVLDWFVDLMYAAVLTVFDMIKDVFFWVVKTVLDLVMSVLDGLSEGANFDVSQYITSLPPEVTSVMGALHLGNCMALLGVALLIRLVLQLIPFVRLGS